MIEKRFKHLSSKWPTQAKDQSFVKYNTAIGYSWINDPYSKGSYSYVFPGQEDILLSITGEFRTLFAPIQNLYFVGEHTTIHLDMTGTMEAACESGERIARAILSKYN